MSTIGTIHSRPADGSLRRFPTAPVVRWPAARRLAYLDLPKVSSSYASRGPSSHRRGVRKASQPAPEASVIFTVVFHTFRKFDSHQAAST